MTNITTEVPFVSNTVSALDGLRTQRKSWERNEYKKANDVLYALLADCLAVFEGIFIKASADERKLLRKELEAQLKKDSIKVQRNTVTLTMFIRFVFGSDRKRAHSYAYVLKAAISSGVPADKLADYINEQGGMEEVKRKMVVSEKALKKREDVAMAQDAVKAAIDDALVQPLATVQLANITGDYAVLLAKPSANGEVAIVATLSDVNEALYKQLLVRMAKVKAEDDIVSESLNREAVDLLAIAEPQEQAQAA